MEDRHVGRTHDAHFHVAYGPAGIFPAGDDERQNAGKKEEKKQDHLDGGLGPWSQEPVDKVGANVGVN